MIKLLCSRCGVPTTSNQVNQEQIEKTLAGSPLCKQLPALKRYELAKLAQYNDFSAGQDIVCQGDAADAFYIILQGSATITVDGQQQTVVLRQHDYFGEGSLLNDEPQGATITAASKVTCAKISRDDFVQGFAQALSFSSRKAIYDTEGNVQVQPPSPKTRGERELMAAALRSSETLQKTVNLTACQIDKIIDLAWKENVPANATVIMDGDPHADYFYIVQEGAFRVIAMDSGNRSAEAVLGAAKRKQKLGSGDYFGELALLCQCPRTATVQSLVSSIVWVIDRMTFKEVLMRSAEDLALENIVYLEKAPTLNVLASTEKKAIAKALTEMVFYRNMFIFKQGEVAEAFYILIEGTVSVIEDDQVVNTLTASTEQAECFGERALQDSAPRSASIRVVSDRARALTLDRDSFHMLMTSLKMSASLPPARQCGLIKSSDLTALGLLGCGAFGAVQLVEHKATQETFALKNLSKGFIVKAGMKAGIMNEKSVQLACDSPFVVKLYETFADDQFLRLLLEPALGGELLDVYQERSLFGDAGHTKFYMAGVVLAFAYLHRRKVVYRDLKPENLLLNGEGHLKVADFGLSKVVVGKTYTTCGTADYFAPEVVRQQGHSFPLDWWTLGILVFELMSGHPPFVDRSTPGTWAKIMKGFAAVTFPPSIDSGCQDFIMAMCQQTPAERLPMMSGGIDNIKRHRWVKDFDWKGMEDFTLRPPFRPELQDQRDRSNFAGVSEADMPPYETYEDDGTGWDDGFATNA